MGLGPVDEVTPAALARGEADLVRDAGWASLTGALSGGVILASFAVELGAGPAQIGLLSAIPFIAQWGQLPAIALVERFRQRRRIGVWSITAARVLILGIAALPLVAAPATAFRALLMLQFVSAALVSVGSCAVNAWLHQLIPQERLGHFFARRLFWGTAAASAGTLVAGYLIERAAAGQRLEPYAAAFFGAALASFASSWYLSRAPEPRMQDAGPAGSTWSRLRAPVRDRNFRRVLVFLGAWNLASNIAAPFFTVYLIRQLGYGLSTVTALWVTGQVANALTLYLWGRLSDRLSNKAVLAVALPVYFACVLALVFASALDHAAARLVLLVVLHALMGAASGGIGLASGNLGLKLAPRGQATAYLATIGLVSATLGGLAPLLGGALAEWFQATRLALVVRWESPVRETDITMLAFAHWEFLFALSAALGLYAIHALSRVTEGAAISERLVIQELALEALRAVNQLSTIGGALGGLFPFQRLAERRRAPREPPA
ncbi:MAG TPA: MFS transporter [Methylibium sp.]|uniref:MFS transporter n=1 Tax=Methylibium sp. TaxID=2067992 RepID=UPI002DB67C2D|nr:MFS transporter [Methylibium sp.]HEU4460287.1 MFS transporter [Methylibium sp.]